MSDTLILGNAALPIVPTAADLPDADLSQAGWAELAPGVYWQGRADDYAASATIDIVGVADANEFEAQFLLLP